MATETAVAEKAEESSKDFLEMPDEEFLKLNAPPPSKEKEKVEEKAADPEPAPEQEEADKPAEKPAEKPADEKVEEPKEKELSPSGSKPAVVVTEPETDKASDKESQGDKPKGATKAEPESKAVDYEGFFKQIMTPFKANGKTFEVKSPEEAIRLMQKGAGYGRKLQDMQPHLKVLRMLEKNNLLDESKLSYLIDLNLKKPDAIKKLIKDGGIDPLDLNTDDKVTYTPTNHAVSDKEVAFHQAIAEVQTQPGGHATLQHINQTWDQESKGLLWDEPEIFGVIQSQRENGIYDQILAEIDRQKLLGQINHSAPFLQAYKVAGDHLVKTNGFKASTQSQPPNGAQPQVIATRTATPKPQAQNSEKAAAAAPTKAVAAGKPNLTVNPLEMADDDFMKQFNGRF